MSDLLEKVIKEDTLPIELAEEYLKIYVADIEWKTHINKLWKNFNNKNKDEQECKLLVKKAISCAVLLPSLENTQIPDPPQSLLFWCTAWAQFNEKDWFSLFKETVEKDIQVKNNRKKIIEMGIIDPIDYSPLTRQAFNWLYDQAESSGCIDESNKDYVTKKLKNLVSIYGGAVISSIFVSHKNAIEKVTNWRSGYFFEKEIYKIYSLEKIMKIKNMEFTKTNTNYIIKYNTLAKTSK